MERGGENTQLDRGICVERAPMKYRSYTAMGEPHDAFDLVKRPGDVPIGLPVAPVLRKQSPVSNWQTAETRANACVIPPMIARLRNRGRSCFSSTIMSRRFRASLAVRSGLAPVSLKTQESDRP